MQLAPLLCRRRLTQASATNGLAVAEVGRPHRRIVPDLLGRADGDPLSEVEYEDDARQGEDRGDVVLDDHHGQRMLAVVHDLAEDREQVLRRFHVQPREWLVEEEHVRIAGERTSDLHQADDAERQRCHRRFAHPGEL